MTICLDVIKRARRKLQVYDRAEELDPLDAAEGLESLIGFYKDLVASGALGALTATIISADYEAAENVRIVNTGVTPYAITLPQTIEDEDAEDSVRTPRERSIVEIAGEAPALWIYEARLGGWTDILSLSLTDEAPLTAAFGNSFISRFAVDIADENGAQVGPATVAASARFMRALTASYDAPRPVVAGVYF